MTQYHIIQYVPDIVLNERINVGVLVYDKGIVFVGETCNWTRVCSFSERTLDIDFIREVLVDLRSCLNRRKMEIWMNCLQASYSRYSILSPEELFKDLCERFKMVPL